MEFNALNTFLLELSANNHKAWFDANRDVYTPLRTKFIAFVDELIEEAANIDPSLAGLQGKNCIFRINRDVRFSANKNPYKTNFSAYLSRGGKKFPGAGYYFHFEPGQSFLAAGIWMPEPELLKSIRQEIDYGWASFSEILQAAQSIGLSFDGEKLSRPPKGYEADNPAIEILKSKSFVLTEPYDLLAGEQHLKHLFLRRIGHLKPFVDFLNQACASSTD